MKMEEALDEVRRRRLLIDRLDAWLFSEIAPHTGRRVLEVGCGLGNLLRHLLDRELVVCVDVSGSSVEAVQREFGSHRHVTASCKISSMILRLPLPNIASIPLFPSMSWST